MICSLYAHYTGFDRIQQIAQSFFPKAKLSVAQDALEITIKGGLLKPSSTIRIQYRQKPNPSYYLAENDNSAVTNNLRGLYGFVSKIASANEPVKSLFLQKITTLNCEFTISQPQGETKELRSLIQQLAQEFDAILFVQPGTIISKSNAQHFLDKNLNLLLDQQGNCEVDSLAVQIDAALYDSPQTELTEDQLARKASSEKLIAAHPIKVSKSLPCIESESGTSIRPPKDIAQRVTVLAITNLVAFNTITNEDAMDYLRAYKLDAYLTPGEQAFLSNPTEEKKNHETWKCEGIWTLLWALKKVDTLPFPNELCNLGAVPAGNYPVAPNKDPNDFIDSITETRSKAEILDANDLYYRLDWACVDARIKGQPMQVVHPGVVYERHYALNWLIGYMGQEWDDVSCDT